MNKTLKFATSLIPAVLAGQKTSTWRPFDDKNLQAGDKVDFLDAAGGARFATAELTEVTEKMFSEVTESDYEGHERYPDDRAMYLNFTMSYNRPVTPGTLVKIIKFKLL
jgi:hypothetical protein